MRSLLVTMLVFGVLSASNNALSQPAAQAPLAESLTGEAKTAYEAGRVLASADDHAAAFARFKLAYEKSRDPRLLWNMAAMQKSLHRYANAHFFLRRYLSEAGERLSPEEKKETEALLRTLETVMTRLKLSTGAVKAKVVIDGHAIAETPLAAPIPLEAGSHKLKVESAGYRPFESDLVVEGHEDITANIDLKKTDDPMPGCKQTTASWIPTGKLVIRAKPGARVTLDGEAAGEGHVECVLTAGPHEVKVATAAVTAYSATITIKKDETFAVEGKRSLSTLAEEDTSGPSTSTRSNDAPIPMEEHPKGCGCRAAGAPEHAGLATAALVFAGVLGVRARRRHS